jgi:hypothetical protein
MEGAERYVQELLEEPLFTFSIDTAFSELEDGGYV